MFGRIRASTSSLETLEGSPSKILKDDTFSIYEATLMKLKIGARLDTSEVIDDSSVSSPCAKEANQPDFNPESTSCSEKTMMDTESDNSSPRVSDIVSSGNSELRRQVNLTILDFFRVVNTGDVDVSSSAKTTTSSENGSSECISSTSVDYDCRNEVVGVQILQDCEMSD
ncbi:hypothetical protein LR48_Vigan01g227300 [Vigna angularis]|uniref:Uncharacterized protein n=1 Tax=Phaseolus angularis TaxID=3914 RepID=A0A0L9TQL4_PHAAN|nr:uncharacterized protein LOC108322973 [Vigna angularis]KAG2408235.1 uncharacterized protein HKW66_Vig0030570 [Vigna angularis]KOM32717.1 hypothetical protein LR48_Vigan01g227300 [Vigna angularis]